MVNGGATLPQIDSVRGKKKPPALLEIARYDPLPARRTLENRRAAMKAKERRVMLEHHLERLYFEAAALNVRMRLRELSARCINEKNRRLRQGLNQVEQQVEVQDTMNDEVRKEIEELKRKLKMKQSDKNSEKDA